MNDARIFDEMSDPDTGVRAPYADLHAWLEGQTPRNLLKKRKEAETIFKRLGIA